MTCAHAMVEEDVNQVAVERGPLVYCLEGMDADIDTLDELILPSDIRLQPEEFEIEGRKVLSLRGDFLRRKSLPGEEADRNALYRDYVNSGYETVPVRLIPYFAWDNRGLDEMRVWIPVTDVSGRPTTGEKKEHLKI